MPSSLSSVTSLFGWSVDSELSAIPSPSVSVNPSSSESIIPSLFVSRSSKSKFPSPSTSISVPSPPSITSNIPSLSASRSW